VLEDLRVSNMSISARGNLDEPGRNIAAKSGLNKAILDQGWFNFRLMFGIQAGLARLPYRAVDPRNTSRTCPKCWLIAKENRKNERFRCFTCGHVGALNIGVAGQAASACGAERAHETGTLRKSRLTSETF
jgi:putative transposase